MSQSSVPTGTERQAVAEQSDAPVAGELPLDELRSIDRADVYKNGRLAAHLERGRAGTVFAYTPDWVGQGGPPVSSSLPITAEPRVSPSGALPAYFAGLLPEGRRLSALRRSVKTSADDELTLVLAVGSDAIGDVQVVPNGTAPTPATSRLQVRDFKGVRFADLLADLDIHIDRVGLPGVQAKASLTMLNLPVAVAGNKFLLKLNPPEWPNLVQNEAFFIEAARQTGIEAVRAQLVLDADEVPGLAVRRFDRIEHNNTQRMLAVEDGCQVLDRHPEAKYRIATEELLARLSSLCEAPLPAARVFLQQMVFAYLTANGDAHAKNFSILQNPEGRWAPAPAYDLPSSQPYGDHTLALSVQGKRDGQLSRLERSGAQLHRYRTPNRLRLAASGLIARATACDRRLPWYVPAGGSNEFGSLGYVEAAHEIAGQVQAGLLPAPATVVTAVGSGGTVAGLALGLRLAGLDTRVFGVVVNDAFPLDAGVIVRLANGTADLMSNRGAVLAVAPIEPSNVTMRTDWLGETYGDPTPASIEAVAAAEPHQLHLEPVYTGKSLAAIRDRARVDPLAEPVLWLNPHGPR